MRKSKTGIWLKMIPLVLLIVVLGSCKNKKKMSELSDPQEVSEQIEEELEDDMAMEEETEPVERVAVKEPTRTEKLENYFEAVAQATTTNAANSSIQEAVSLFDSPDAPVLIMIYRGNGVVDYDEPTTIGKYLDYLKDTGNNKAVVEEMVLNENGQIKELVLKK